MENSENEDEPADKNDESQLGEQQLNASQSQQEVEEKGKVADQSRIQVCLLQC